MKTSGKVIVVTGAGSGIGRQLALQLVARGASVAAVDLSAAGLAETAGLVSDAQRIETFELNVADHAAVEALPARVISRFGAVDGVINNAGIIQPMVKVNDLEFETITRVMNVNFNGVLYMVKAFLPHLLARPEAHIANVSSMGGFLPVPGQTVYGASKAAVKLLTEGLWSELADTNVRVTVVFPGATKTDIAKNSGMGDMQARAEAEGGAARSFPMTPADEAARTIIDGIENDRFRVLIGRDSKMMDLFYRLSPRRAAKLIYQQMRSLLGS